jgi:hypothetical protein
MAKPPAHPLEKVLVEMTTMMRAIADRQTVIEQALIYVAKGEALPADLADQLNQTVRNAEAARELMLRGVSPAAMLQKIGGRG